MKILSLEIENILSIEKAQLSFSDTGLVLVEGYNYDVDRANGAGKSAIFNALSFALFDKVARKITASEILRRDAKTGRVVCKAAVGDSIWEVTRSRPKGVIFKKDGIVQDINQEEWEKILRFNFNQFLLSMYAAQSTDGATTRFLQCNDSSKKTFLLDLFNLHNFSDCKKIIDDQVKTSAGDIEKLKNLASNMQSKIDAYSESAVDEKALTLKIEQVQQSIVPLKQQVVELSNVNAPNLDKYATLESNLYKEQAKINGARHSRQTIRASYDKLERQIKPYDPNISCSLCGSSLSSDEAEKKHEEHQLLLRTELQQLKQDMDALDIIIAKDRSIQDLIRKLNDKKNQDSADYTKAKTKITELQYAIHDKESQIDTLNQKIAAGKKIATNIEELNGKILEINAKSALLVKDLELLKTLSSIFSPTGAQAYVLDSVIESFNEIVSNYISIIWPNATYSLNSYKENSKGEVVAKFSENLIMAGKEVSTGSLSGGELKALSLCVDFAMLDVLKSNFGLSCNPIILDEPFDGLDVTGREIVLDLLQKMAQDRQIIIIDHMSEIKAAFSKTIRVEKRNSISTICEQE